MPENDTPSDRESSVHKVDKRTLSFDTRVLKPELLTSEEKCILKQINWLVQDIYIQPRKLSDAPTNSERGFELKEDQRNNVIMIDGQRGAGKTSLLLTLLKGWRNPHFFDRTDLSDSFGELTGKVITLNPIDFDPLPPDMSIYNWIIQAFQPLLGKQAEVDHDTFLNQHEACLTLQERFRRLHHTAACGWSTGQLKQSYGHDIAEYFVWQDRQLGDWHNLRSEWTNFLDALLTNLERRESTDPFGRMRKGSILALPIDDLDLQVARTRELLQALRLLRHDRLVYILTGDKEGADLALAASFYQDFLSGQRLFPSSFQDEIVTHVRTLGQSIHRKTIPKSQLFTLAGIAIDSSVGLQWTPHGTGQVQLKDILDGMWGESNSSRQTLSEYLQKRRCIERIYRPFRLLQHFCDRFTPQLNSTNEPVGLRNADGIAEFFSIAINDTSEEDAFATAVADSIEGNDGGSYIEIASKPAVYAASPRRLKTLNGQNNSRIKWALSLDFICKTEADDSFVGKQTKFDSASPEHLLALDLADWCPLQVVLVNDLRLTSRSVGFVWTEYPAENIVIPWPMLKTPSCPSKWLELFQNWRMQASTIEIDSPRTIFSAWYEFLMSSANNESTPFHETDAAKFLSSSLIGLDKKLGVAPVLWDSAENEEKVTAANEIAAAQAISVDDLSTISVRNLAFTVGKSKLRQISVCELESKILSP